MALTFFQDAGTARLRIDMRAAAPFAVAAGIYVLLVLLGRQLLNDADTYWQIALGSWMLAKGQVPHTDTFSFTMNGAPWISSQWLAQVLYAKAYAFGGFAAVVALAAAAVALAFGLLTYVLLRRFAVMPAIVLTVAGFVLSSPHLVARPHALALPAMVAWVAGLVRAADEDRAPSFMLLPLMTLWANLHGGFTLGILFVGACALDVLWRAQPMERRAVALRWAVFGILAVVAACVTPYGPESLLVTRRILGLGEALSLIGEWQPQNFARITEFEIVVLAAVGFALHRGLTLPPVRIVIVLGLLHMALSQSRNCEVLGLLAPLVIAAPLATQIGRVEMSGRPAGRTLAALMSAVVLAGATVAAAMQDYRPRPAITPAAGVDALKAAGAGRILNDYDLGGYMISRGLAPFIDGRTELYGEAFVVRHHRAVRLENVADFFRLLDEYGIDATLLNPATPAAALLDRTSGWKRIQSDGASVVHVRTAPVRQETVQ